MSTRTPTLAALALATVAVMSPASAHAQSQSSSRSSGSNLVDWLFIQPAFGASYIDVMALSSQQLFPPTPVSPGVTVPTVNETRGWGYHFGATAGMRFGPIAFGPHVDFSQYSQFNLGRLAGEVQLRIPIPVVQPFVRVDFGYAWLGSINPSRPETVSSVSVKGWTLAAGVGVDIWLGRFFTVGVAGDLYFLNLTSSTSLTTVGSLENGSSVGVQFAGTVQAGLHL